VLAKPRKDPGIVPEVFCIKACKVIRKFVGHLSLLSDSEAYGAVVVDVVEVVEVVVVVK